MQSLTKEVKVIFNNFRVLHIINKHNSMLVYFYYCCCIQKDNLNFMYVLNMMFYIISKAPYITIETEDMLGP